MQTKEDIKKYKRQWYLRNKERVKRLKQKWYKMNKDYCLQRDLAYARENRLGIIKDGKLIRVTVKKRPYPDQCELCGNSFKRYLWHHWNPQRPQIGLWLCCFCHGKVESWENGLIVFYLKLKEEIENEYR